MSKDVSILDLDRITQVLHRRCESMDVGLTWSKQATTAMTDGRNIILPVVKQPITKDAMDKLYGFVIHECGHHTRPDAFKILKALSDPPPELCALFNICEDDGMEREVADAHIGDAVGLGTMNTVVLGEVADAWKEKPIPEDATEQQVAPMSVCGLGQLSRLEWDGVPNQNRTRFFENLPPIAQKLLNDLHSEGYVDKMLATKDPHDTWDLAVDLYKRLFPERDEDEAEQQRSDGHSMQPAPPSESSGEDGQVGEVSGMDDESEDGAGSQSKGTVEGEEDKTSAKAKKQQGTVISWKDAVLSEHNEWKPKKDGDVAGSIGIDWTDYKAGSVVLMPQKLVNVIDCRGHDQQVQTGRHGDNEGTPESFMPDNTGSRAFGNQIRRYLQSQRRTKVRRERYHGNLDKSSIVRLGMPPIDGGDWNKKLFYDMVQRKELNTAIHVLTDWSGSMQGTKMVHAADASGRLVYVFDRVLRVPVQLAAFTNGRTRCDIGLIKGFKDRSISPRQIAENFSKFYKYSSANNDADSVMWAYNQLIRRKEERKILIVLSDGAPAGAYGGSGSSNLKHVCRSIERDSKVELYGVGIESNAVETYYSNAKVLHDSDEINKTLFEIIREGAYRGTR